MKKELNMKYETIKVTLNKSFYTMAKLYTSHKEIK